MSERIEADYLIETPVDPAKAAEAMAGEQSSGTFVSVPGETPELRERSAARVEALEVVGEVAEPSLGGGATGERYTRAKVTLSWPMGNIGASIPNLVATVAGNLFELRQFSGLRLRDIRLPREFGAAHPGPKFGIEGTRRLSGVERGPLIGTIVKPSVGFGPEETASLAGDLAAAGIDFIKDDELQSDGPNCPFDARARAVMRVLNDHAEKTGKKVMFAFNLTGEVDEMRWRHDLLLELGATCAMVSLNSVGFAGFLAFSRHSELPIHAHRCGWGYLSRADMLGWDYTAWSKLWRLAGADHMHVNGLRNKFSEADDSVVASALSVGTPMWEDKPCVAMPVFSSGQTAVQAAETYARVGHADCIHAAGGGIMAHPDGPAAGVASLREAWEAAQAGVAAEDYAATRPALKGALEAFG
ncbi:ribulose-bisphosphate carboxylase large subunit family protein [Vannielia litorea]|uniref:ribulose-bisphosphate carboxylase large subunit family protein n=1 Tax=Vannielia litorea TaxID=1217970 RepID=UPI001C943015|nr:ribulose-bisphosphate carboxylase large subunit family protein [Vannielia litorea]MBY6048903.1 ribulose-bisphosphate carboxylase large subunit family protein [Vannielia litorea]MBY6076317.1 ribulose-bisphosphate carboxylase large subunit family protein [Vannielia litorea]